MIRDGEPEIDVSVIVPMYNARPYLQRCAEALLAQTYPRSRYEVVLVDNNSTDGSAELARTFSGVQVLLETKQGAYAARNRGVAAARGAILAFTDADCVTAPDWLERMVEAVRAPGVELALGAREYGTHGSTLALASTYEAERSGYVFGAQESELAFGYTNNMAVRRPLFERHGPFLEVQRGADSVFVFRVMEHYSAKVVRYVPRARVRHLELTTLAKWLGKKLIYGRVAQHMFWSGVRKHRELTSAESREILHRTLQLHGYSRAQTVRLGVAVTAGMICYRVGRLSAHWLTDDVD